MNNIRKYIKVRLNKLYIINIKGNLDNRIFNQIRWMKFWNFILKKVNCKCNTAILQLTLKFIILKFIKFYWSSYTIYLIQNYLVIKIII